MKKSKEYIKTGDYWIIDEWVNNIWPANAKKTIKNCITNYRDVVKFRTSTGDATISRPIADSFQLVINYNSTKKCFIIWNAAIQNGIHGGKKMRLTIGKAGEDLLHKEISSNSIKRFFRDVNRSVQNAKCVELILVVGENALADFCKDYKKWIRPDKEIVPKGKTCLYAVAGGEVEFICGDK